MMPTLNMLNDQNQAIITSSIYNTNECDELVMESGNLYLTTRAGFKTGLKQRRLIGIVIFILTREAVLLSRPGG